jgi:prephenate dehydrogenase
VKEDDFTIVGLGLIGSSIAAALRRDGAVVHGFDRDPRAGAEAERLGLVHNVASALDAALEGARFVILAAPVPAILELLPAARAAAPEAVIVDVGSVKAPIVERMAALSRADRTIGGHPIAGKETSGPSAADADLFRGRPFVLTPHEGTSAETVEECRSLAFRLGAHPLVTDAATHDRTVARTSHLPQSISTTLAAGLQSGDEAFTGTGLRDMTRLALSDPGLWMDILLANRVAVTAELRDLAARAIALAEALERNDRKATKAVLETGRERARVLREGIAA